MDIITQNIELRKILLKMFNYKRLNNSKETFLVKSILNSNCNKINKSGKFTVTNKKKCVLI